MQFRILGPLELVSDGQSVRVAGTRQQKLLALLLLNVNRVVPVDRLIDELWDTPPQSARQQVHNSIGNLRRTIGTYSGDAAIVWTEAGYRLEAPEELIDMHPFSARVGAAGRAAAANQVPTAIELLRTALDIWHGDALTGLTGALIESAAAKLNEQRLVAIEDLMALRLQNRESATVVSELQELVAEHPLRESFRITLMRALYLSGRQADALAVYDQGRRLLADELGLDPSANLQRAHADVLNGVQIELPSTTSATAGSPAPDSGTGTAPARSYLPHDTSDFSGRSTELLKLLGDARTASPTALTISAVDGMGGVGKTTLAVHLGHEISEEYPDGHYFIDLRGFTSGADPVTAELALDALLGDSGMLPELIPSNVESKSAAWRSRVSGQRILLILDNATDASHVRPLLPGTAGALVVVTSRRKLSALEGALALSLDVMPQEDAVALFEKVVGTERCRREPDAVASAIELCGHLPLAIRIAAARLRDRASWSVADLVDRLADHAQRVRFLRIDDRCVMTALRVSYRYLSPEQQRVFRLLSLHPGGDFDAYVAAALADLPIARTDDCLDALFDANLLKQNTTGRFYFHDLIRDCSQELLTEVESDAERNDAVGRMFDYYLHTAHTLSAGLHNVIYDEAPQVDRVPEEIRSADSLADAVNILNEEYRNLVAITQLAIDEGWHRQAWQLVCTLQPYLETRNYGGSSYALFQGGAQAARAASDLRGESSCLRGLVAVCRYLKSTAEARSHLARSLELTKQVGDTRSETAQLVQLGNLYLYEDQLEEARAIFREAEPLTEQDPSGFLRASVAINLGVIARDLGEYDQALDSLRGAVMLISSDNPDSLVFTMWSIGTVLHLLGEHDQALREFTLGLHTSRENKLERGEALAFVGLAGVNRSLGNLDESLKQGRLALTLARSHDLRATECEALNALGETTVAMRDAARAEQVFDQARERARQYGFARYEARAMDGFAHAALLRGDLNGARRYWEEATKRYPRGIADAQYAARHLVSLRGNENTTCFRCETTSSSSPHRLRPQPLTQ
ncbi:hypothetical protein F0L68_33670 [Solihabitans fulvus]|uniref:OmpR/PhoB-type domain-containing protein n=1 Tax=Solihabitans fulvus TaxID=1892852 RepID=A0A5B2WR08_9PSEU|nr:hypothetical protein F0L68_33670 [Solihabitans fulvus]